jgi:hypothetical protein
VCPLELPGYAECESFIIGEPLPPGLLEPSPASIPAGSSTQTVSVELASIGATLEPDTTYHFRVIATNTSDGGIVYGADERFTTPGTESLSERPKRALLPAPAGGQRSA